MPDFTGQNLQFMPETKKKALPAWIREGLEKMAKDKQKQEGQQAKETQERHRKGSSSKWEEGGKDSDESDKEVQYTPNRDTQGSKVNSSGHPKGILKKSFLADSSKEREQEDSSGESEEEEDGENGNRTINSEQAEAEMVCSHSHGTYCLM